MADRTAPPDERPDWLDDLETEEDVGWDYFPERPGSLPGTLHVDVDALPPEIFGMDYTETQLSQYVFRHPRECIPHLQTPSMTWFDVRGLGHETVLRQLGEVFQLHPLTLEDVVNVPQRPKVEIDGDRIIAILRMLSPRMRGEGCVSEQVSIIFSDRYVLTVKEDSENDAFEPVRDRLRTRRGIIRSMGADYLAVSLIDAIIDGFFPILEAYADRIERLENQVLFDPNRKILEEIYDLKRELLGMRRFVLPQIAAIAKLLRESDIRLSRESKLSLQDCHEHATDVMEILNLYQEMTVNLMDLYMSSISNRMNEIMKLLAVVSTIFIPLTFIAGVYGMNFNPDISRWNMPELNWVYGYPFALMLMAAIAAGLLFYFWRRGWFKNLT